MTPTTSPSTGNPTEAQIPASDIRPWWREPYVWMVIAGPSSAVIACMITAFYILQGPDAVVSEASYPVGVEISEQVKTAKPPMQPAAMGRNHSATGGANNAAR